MKRTMVALLAFAAFAAFADITGPGVYELNEGDDINAKVEWLDAQKGASDYLQTIVLNPGTYTIDNEVMMTNKLVICGKTGNPADVIVDVQLKNKAFCLNNAEAVLHSLTVTNGCCKEAVCYGVVRIVKPNGRGNVSASSKGTGAGGTVSNVVLTACQSSGVSAGGMLYVYAANGLATHCVVRNCTAARQRNNGKRNGIFLYVESGEARNCLVADNTCTVSWQTAAPTVNLGAVAAIAGKVVNCTVVGNKMTATGQSGAADCACAGVLVGDSGKAVNTLVSGNESDSTAEHFSQWDGSSDNFVNCALDTAAKVNDTCLSVADPGFVDAEMGDYRLTDSSACKNAGTTDATYAYGTTDLAGSPRFRDVGGVSKIDIGAYQAAVLTRLEVDYELPERLYDRIDVRVAVESAGFGDAPTYYYDFNSDGVADLITGETVVTQALGIGSYRISVSASNLTAQVGQTVTCAEGFAVVAHPIHYVDEKSANPVSPYLTVETAAKDVQSALDVAGCGEEVVIRPGIYEVSRSLYVTNDYLTVHGSTGNPEDVIVRATTTSNRCMQVNAGAHTVVHSLVLENGRCGSGVGPVNTFGYGTCLNIANIEQSTGASPGIERLSTTGEQLGGTVSNCVIRSGQFTYSYLRSGGVFLYGPDALLTHCIITNNVNGGGFNKSGWFGATGLYLAKGARAEHCLVAHNSSGANTSLKNIYYQSAVFVGTNAVLRYSTVTDNDCAFVGGVNVAENGRFEKCVIAGNRVLQDVVASARRTVWGAFTFPTVDTTASRFNRDNLATDIESEASRAATVAVYGAQTTNACDVALVDVGLGAGSVSAEVSKLFRKPAVGDYSPRTSAPSAKLVPIEAESDMPSVDLRGQPRASGGAYDLGAYQAGARGLIILFR